MFKLTEINMRTIRPLCYNIINGCFYEQQILLLAANKYL